MHLTEKQKNNIYHLSTETLIEILDECKKRLGLVSPDEYRKIIKYSKSRTQFYKDIKAGKIKTWNGLIIIDHD